MVPGKRSFIIQQWLAGILVTNVVIQLGFLGGWVSPTLARLMISNADIHLNPEQASWVASLVNIGRLFGGVLGAILTSYFGSKKALLVSLIPLGAGWLLIVLAYSVQWLYVARLCSGLGLGMSFSTFPLYIGEVSIPEIRGALISLASLGSPLGQVIATTCGSYLSISMASAIYFGLCIILMVAFFFLPESPHHLMKIGDREGAKKSINWYRGGKGVEVEFDAVEKFVMSDGSKSFAEKLQEFKTPAVRKATFQVITLFTFMQVSGLNSIVFYMETILIQAKFTMINPALVVIYVSIASTIAAAVSIFLIDRCGRKFLLLVSSSGITISMIALMIYFLYLNSKMDLTNISWIPMASMFLFLISFFLGLMPVPSTSLSELFPANIKCIASGISGVTAAVMSFLSAKTYQPLVDALGEAYVFLIYAILSALVIPYTLFVMLETKGKSLQQIQDELVKRK